MLKSNGPIIRAGSSPLQLTESLDQWGELIVGSGDTTAVTGTGATSLGLMRIAEVRTGTTASSTALFRSGGTGGFAVGQARGVIDWTKLMAFHFLINVTVATSTGVSRLLLGKTTGDGLGVLARKGIGLNVANLTLTGKCHDGSNLTTTATLATLTVAVSYRVLIVTNNGTVEWFVDGVSKASSTAGPAALGTAGEACLFYEVDNGADSAQQSLDVFYARYFITS